VAGAKVLGGYIGILTGIAALYVSFAEVTNGTFGRTVVPLGTPFVNEERPAQIPGEADSRAA
jgi:hypothetical protein